jgi:hypothetical protein
MHKSRWNLFRTTTPNTCCSSVWNILHVNVLVEIELLCVIYISVNFENIWFRLLGIEQKVNVGVINRLCMLNDICFLYPNKQSTFRLCISLFYTICFGWFYWLKAVWIATIQMENYTEFDASILHIHFMYIYLLLTLKEIFPPQPSSIYFIVILNLNRWNIWLKIFVEHKWMFTIYSVQFVLITKTHVYNWISWNTETFIRRT